MRIASVLVVTAVLFQAGNALAGVTQVVPVPEPSSLALAAFGFGAVAVVKFLRKR